MKIQSHHYQHLKPQIAKVDIQKVRLELLNSDKQPRNFQRRLQWDCLYAAGLSKWICDHLYPYMNDDNITAALNQIFKELNQFVPAPRS